MAERWLTENLPIKCQTTEHKQVDNINHKKTRQQKRLIGRISKSRMILLKINLKAEYATRSQNVKSQNTKRADNINL